MLFFFLTVDRSVENLAAVLNHLVCEKATIHQNNKLASWIPGLPAIYLSSMSTECKSEVICAAQALLSFNAVYFLHTTTHIIKTAACFKK